MCCIDARRETETAPTPFPVWTLKRRQRPTTIIHDAEVRRLDERDGGFTKARDGLYGEFLQKEYRRFVSKHPLSGALDSITGMLGQWVEPPQALSEAGGTPWAASSWMPMPGLAGQRAPGTDDPKVMARHIKETAYFLRADMVGICRLPPYAVFSHNKYNSAPVEVEHRYAIAILVDQDWRTAEAFNGHDWISNAMSFLGYSTSAFIACILADYIRRLGYPARAHHAMNYQIVLPPILLWAGLGEMCRIGDIVLNPFLGPCFKAAVVTTDLPLAVDQPIDFRLQDFCTKCGKCARECPAQAISHGGKIMHNGYEKWPNNVEKCTAMRVGNQHGAGCGTCIKVCPWNKPFTPFHRLVNWTMRHVPPLRRFAIWGDDLMGYGRPDYRKKWWLDLEEIAGELREPHQ